MDGRGGNRFYNGLQGGCCETNPKEISVGKLTCQPVMTAKSIGAFTSELHIVLKLSPWFPTMAQNVSTVLASMVISGPLNVLLILISGNTSLSPYHGFQ